MIGPGNEKAARRRPLAKTSREMVQRTSELSELVIVTGLPALMT
jgi:hypothetical protein